MCGLPGNWIIVAAWGEQDKAIIGENEALFFLVRNREALEALGTTLAPIRLISLFVANR
jgi:hypothetical protein